MLSKRSKNVARSLDWIQLYKFWSSAGLAPRNTGGLTEPLQSQPSPRRAANTWVCLLFSNKYFPIYFNFKTTKDKAYSAVKMNLCLDSVDFCIFLSKREKRKCWEIAVIYTRASIRESWKESVTWHFLWRGVGVSWPPQLFLDCSTKPLWVFVSTEISTNTRDSSSRVNSLSEISVLCQESKVIPVECRLHVQPLRSVWNRVRTKIILVQCPLTLSGRIPTKLPLGIQKAHLETGKGPG